MKSKIKCVHKYVFTSRDTTLPGNRTVQLYLGKLPIDTVVEMRHYVREHTRGGVPIAQHYMHHELLLHSGQVVVLSGRFVISQDVKRIAATGLSALDAFTEDE